MALRNYTSSISPARSAAKIQKLLAENGANRVSVDYEGADIVAITFMIEIGGRWMHFRLEPDIEGILRAMQEDEGVPRRKCTPEQAARTAWKNELEWLDVQFAKIAANQARLEQLLLGYGVTDTGETVYERLSSGENLLASSNPTHMPAK